MGFALVAWLFVTGAVVQIYLAGLGVFDRLAAFNTHREVGYLVGILTLVLIVLAILGRVPRRILVATIVLLVLFALQSAFIVLRDDAPNIAALHPVNGFGILLLALWTAWNTRAYLRREPG
jgi:heme A synthase